jgi:hypothetical protein
MTGLMSWSALGSQQNSTKHELKNSRFSDLVSNYIEIWRIQIGPARPISFNNLLFLGEKTAHHPSVAGYFLK